jgi:outer membrane protein assembly factor BamE (lipoprotein component of BamABCDE complex)
MSGRQNVALLLGTPKLEHNFYGLEYMHILR